MKNALLCSLHSHCSSTLSGRSHRSTPSPVDFQVGLVAGESFVGPSSPYPDYSRQVQIGRSVPCLISGARSGIARSVSRA